MTKKRKNIAFEEMILNQIRNIRESAQELYGIGMLVSLPKEAKISHEEYQKIYLGIGNNVSRLSKYILTGANLVDIAVQRELGAFD